ncbi:MAG: NFACT family protein [Deltaproteobacteria bacterium]|nr:NFACT family protein [Deltaproteobacteria bacterium]
MTPGILKHIVQELDAALRAGVISRIHQPNEKDLVFKVYSRGQDFRLLISAHPEFCRMLLTEEEFENPQNPPRFCAFLRSRITGARIEGITQDEGENIAHIKLAKKTGEGIRSYTLTMELTGKSANVILIAENGVVLDALKYFKPGETTRPVVPGIKLAPLPRHAHGPQGPEFDKQESESWNEAAERFYGGLVKEAGFASEKSRLKKIIVAAEKKLLRLLENVNNDRVKAEAGLQRARLGEILRGSYNLMRRGMKEVEALDYAKEPPEKALIPLDEKLSPSENVDKHFKLAKKAKTAIALLIGRIPKVEAEIEYLKELLFDWENAGHAQGLEALRDELIEAGYVKKTASSQSKRVKAEVSEPIRRLRSSDGLEILVGKTAKGNDLIVRQCAKEGDLWFHAARAPGSHVLIKAAGRAVAEKTVMEAASIAAYFSKLQNEKKTEVICAEARRVKKPKGAKPGMVTVSEYKTLRVVPKPPKGG